MVSDTEEIRVQMLVPASPSAIFDAWMDERRHSAFSAARATVDPWIGGRVTGVNSYSDGTFIRLEQGQLIDFTWRSADFPIDAPDSMVHVVFDAAPGGTMVTVVQKGIPKGQGSACSTLWKERYLAGLQKFFASRESAREAIHRASKEGYLPSPDARPGRRPIVGPRGSGSEVPPPPPKVREEEPQLAALEVSSRPPSALKKPKVAEISVKSRPTPLPVAPIRVSSLPGTLLAPKFGQSSPSTPLSTKKAEAKRDKKVAVAAVVDVPLVAGTVELPKDLSAEPKKAEAKKAEPKKAEPKKAEAKKAEAKKAEPKKAEAKKAEPKKAEPKKAEPKKAEAKKAEPNKAEPKKAEPKKAEPKKAEPKKAEPKKAEPKKVAKPAPKKAAKPAPKKAAKPAPKKVAKPAPKKVAKPAPKKVAKPAPKKVAKPAPKKVAKPAPKKVAKPAPKKVAKPAPKKAAKPAPKKVAKPAPKKAAKRR